jgi:hypothetical protein
MNAADTDQERSFVVTSARNRSRAQSLNSLRPAFFLRSYTVIRVLEEASSFF